jgi:pyruvate dehydrogenase E2 component (dihydrolipoamide acetyltransferase)
MTTFKLPDLGEGLAEAEIVEWHVKVGDRVVVDQPMLSVETAKAVVELPAPFGGVVTLLHAAPGDIVPTGAPLIDFESDSGTVVGNMPPTSDEEFVEPPAAPQHEPHGEAGSRAVPVARALAKRLGVDLAAIKGTGRAGLITLDDVLQRAQVPTAGPGIAKLATRTGVQPAPLRGARRAMAHAMSIARDQVAISTVCDDADIEVWADGGDYMVRLMRAMVEAWRAEPALNAWYDAADNSRLLLKHVDLGVAVDTPGGLLVPVLRQIETKSPAELRAALLAHKEAAHQRNTAAEDLRDFTIMLSNFGSLAGRYGIPQVMPPAVAILGAGKVRRDAVVVGERVAAHRRIPLSLSFDHRCVTGGEACRYLAAVIADLELAA